MGFVDDDDAFYDLSVVDGRGYEGSNHTKQSENKRKQNIYRIQKSSPISSHAFSTFFIVKAPTDAALTGWLHCCRQWPGLASSSVVTAPLRQTVANALIQVPWWIIFRSIVENTNKDAVEYFIAKLAPLLGNLAVTVK